MHGASSYVSFAFVTPTEMLPCEATQQQHLSPKGIRSVSVSASSSTSSVDVVPTTEDHGVNVIVRFFDTLRKAARTQCFSLQPSTTVACIFEMIHAWLPEVGNLVCYTVHGDALGRFFPLVKEVLSLEAEVPGVVFCQEVFLPRHKLTEFWGVVNILVMQSQGDIVSGYIPLIVHRSFMCSKETIQEQIRRLCCASPAEVEYMKSQPLLNCVVSAGFVNLVSFFENCDEGLISLSQIAVVYPAMVTGDLVHLDMVDRMGRRFSVQGMIRCSRRKDNILCYDVEDAAAGHVLEGLTCVQVLPL